MLKKMFSGIGQFVDVQAGRALAARRRQQLAQCEREASQAVTTAYRALYPREDLYAPISAVVEALQDYAETRLRDWRSLPMRQSADGRSARFRYTLDFREVFQKGALGSPLKPLTPSARIADGILAHEGRTENVAVPYHLSLELTVETVAADRLRASCSVREEIDPSNECAEIRNGHWAAPSRMTLRCSGDPGEQLLDHLASAVPQNRPSVDQWIQGEESRHHPVVIAQRAKIADAEHQLQQAEAALARKRGEP